MMKGDDPGDGDLDWRGSDWWEGREEWSDDGRHRRVDATREAKLIWTCPAKVLTISSSAHSRLAVSARNGPGRKELGPDLPAPTEASCVQCGFHGVLW